MPAGRPPKITADAVDTIVLLIKAGNTQEIAATAAGVDRHTFKAWMERGKSDAAKDIPYREFRLKIEQAYAKQEALLVVRVAKAAEKGSAQAAQWLLERRHPARWAKPADRSHLGQAQASSAPGVFAEIDQLAARRSKRTG